MRKRKTIGSRFPKSILAYKAFFGIPQSFIKTFAGCVLIIGLTACAGNSERVTESEVDGITASQAEKKTPDMKSEKLVGEDDTAALLENARHLRETQPDLFDGAKGIIVLGVAPASQAEAAGFQRGDVIVGYQGEPIDSTEALINRVAKVPLEQSVVVDIIRLGRGMQKRVHGGKLGIEIRNIGTQLEDELGRLNQAGNDANDHADYRKAIHFWEQGLTKARAASHRKRIGDFLGNLGEAYSALGQVTRAIEFYQQSLAIDREIGDRRGEGTDLNNLGVAYYSLGQFTRAIEFYQQALAIHREIGDRRGEGGALNNLGVAYSDLGQVPRAIDFYQQALAIHREIGDRRGGSADLNNLGEAYRDLGQVARAIEFYQQSLAIHREIGDPRGEGNTLGNLGMAYRALGQVPRAIDFYQQALAIHREIGDRRGEGKDLGNLGVAYSDLGQVPRAIDFHQQALAIHREIGDRRGEGNALGNLGEAYRALGQVTRAIDFYQQALAIHREIGDRRGEGIDLSNLGAAYHELGQVSRAIDFYQQALAIQSQVGDPDSLWRIWSNLRVAHHKLNHPTPAIFFGKQAVNLIQTLRAHIATLDKDLQKSFLKDKEVVYRDLADLLIEQSRLPEAEQVLAMLKEEEYFDFIRRDSNEDVRTTQASYTPIEQEWKQRYDKITGQLVQRGRDYDALKRKRKLTEAEQARFKTLEKDLTVANQAFSQTLKQLTQAFQSQTGEEAIDYGRMNLDSIKSEKRTLRRLGHGAVLIHTVMTDDKLHLLLTTPKIQIARAAPIGKKALNKKIQAFRAALLDKHTNPQPLARELYQILIAPLKADLIQAKAHTLMWYLDDTLRYLPLAALHDGEHYLIERYPVTVYTAAARNNLNNTTRVDWKVAGLGVSDAQHPFSPLTAVPTELEGIIKRDTGDSDGVLPGEVHLNSQFTADRLKTVLTQAYPVLHIASHFKLQPGDNSASFLLLGNNQHVTLEQIRNEPGYEFYDVDLLTLSACNTALGDKGKGQEVEGFATLAQKNGAQGVMATLWSVNDASTGIFMQNFYRIRQENATMSKAEALRQAQLRFIGRKGLEPRPEGTERGAVDPDDPNPTAKHGNTSTDYTHPYYWAPFIMMGNWL